MIQLQHLISAGALFLLTVTTACAQPRDLPREFEQLLPRGAIAAIRHPSFVSAKDADISDKEWILGVHIDGEARAYSLTLLNSHEVVNDAVGDKNFAAVW